MLTPYSNTGINLSSGIVAVTDRIAVITVMAKTNNDNSRLNKAGFFISVMAERFVSFIQRLGVSVFNYAVISLLPNKENNRFEIFKMVYR